MGDKGSKDKGKREAKKEPQKTAKQKRRRSSRRRNLMTDGHDAAVGPGEDETDPLEAQQWLLESSLALAFDAYDEAIQAKQRDPVVFVLDCEDAIGGEIARSWLGEELIADAIADRALEDEESETTVFAHAFPFAQCRTEVPAVFPYLKPALRTAARRWVPGDLGHRRRCVGVDRAV